MRTIRVMTVDGILEKVVLTGGDQTALWHFDKIVAETKLELGEGYVVQLIDERDNVLAEETT